MSCQKVNYPSKNKAKKAAYAIKAKGNIGAREALYPYFCKHCQAFHLSKTDQETHFHNLK